MPLADMRQRFFLIVLLAAIAVVTTALVPLSIAVMVRNRADLGGRQIVARTRRRLVAAGASIARRFRAATVG